MNYLTARMQDVPKHVTTRALTSSCVHCLPPLNIGDVDHKFFTESEVPHRYSLVHRAEQPFICSLSNGVVATCQGLIFDDTHFFVDSYHNEELVKTVIPVPPFVGALDPRQSFVEAQFEQFIHSYGGMLTTFVTPHSANYHHWMLETLPKFWFIEEHPWILDGALLLPPLEVPFQSETLARIFRNRDVEIKYAVHNVPAIKATHLVFPSFLAPEGHSLTQLEWLRSKFLDSVPKRVKNIYISRGDSRNGRRVKNEAELIEVLEDRYGFQAYVLSDLAHADQVKLFSEANIVLGVSGAGFINHIFADHGAHLIEMHPMNYTNRAHFFTSNILEQTYQFVICETNVVGELSVPIAKVVECVERVL